ncbi:MAG: hypothetical protein SVX38_04870 [Chloroflexota bacterium]|nr:hypothetical protein [Chloroflexota bacterium]
MSEDWKQEDWDRDRDEKEHDEKERDEKGHEEGIDEKYRRDPLAGAVWGLILIWVGLVLFASYQRLLPGLFNWEQMWDNVWGLIAIGVGGILLLEVLLRLVVPAYRRPILGRVILALFLIFVGGGEVIGVTQWWPLILIAVGVTIILRGFFR